jgi:antitoxin (DNA-binding transcriptional repressor) of toxin-antitoxin stability system
MKTANAHQVPEQWPEILRWLATGEEVQVTREGQVIARVVPAKPVDTPDFVTRAKAVWGENPQGKPLSSIVSEARGGGL